MKHVIKKFLKSHQVGDQVIEIINSTPIDINAIEELKKTNFENYHALLQTEGNEIIYGFKYNSINSTYFIPEPNPIVIYFETARFNYRQISNLKDKLFEELNLLKPNAYKTLDNFHVFFIHASISATFMFNAIEAFINGLIPKDYKYSKVLERKTEVYDVFQIQKYLQFEEKIKNVVPEIKNNSFHVQHSHKYDKIIKLKDFRDEIVHTKSYSDPKSNYYQKLYSTSLDFDYKNTLLAVRDFINYYEPNLIQECKCDNDW